MKKNSLNKIAISAAIIAGLATPAALATEVPQVPQTSHVTNAGVSTEPMKVVKVKATKKKAPAKKAAKKSAAKKTTKKRVRRSIARK